MMKNSEKEIGKTKTERVLITGGYGFIGKFVCNTFRNADHDVMSVDKTGGNKKIDITDKEHLEWIFREYDPTAVIHLAALAGAPGRGGSAESGKNPYEFFRVNFLGTLNVFESCRQFGVKKVIHMSSFSPYGVTRGVIWEGTVFNPENPYGGSKVAAEYVARIYAKCFGIKTVIFRAPLIVGEGQIEYNSIHEFVDCVLKNKPIIIFGEGTHLREWVHPEDVARAFLLGLDYAEQMEASYEVFNLGSGDPLSMNDLAERIMKVTGKTVKLEHVKKPIMLFDQVTDLSKVRNVLGWQPQIGIEDIIKRVVKFRENL